MRVRPEETSDQPFVYEINASAFEGRTEAELVDTLRERARPVVSLVAEDDGALAGHILFSPVSLFGHPASKIMGLAPMAVTPDHQGRGIGSALVRAGLKQCGRLGFGAVVVLGHPEYYPRFGFSAASRYGIDCEFDAPNGAFMAIELQPGYLHGASGQIRFHSAFRDG